MHEWALADAVVAAAARLPRAASPRTVTVLVGELQAIDSEIFTFALASLAGQQGLAGVEFRLRAQPAVFACRSCGRRWGLRDQPDLSGEQREAIHFLPESAHAFVRCPGCGSVDFGVEAGRGVSIEDGQDDTVGPGEGP
jgi:hydrogenase nickel incorporation protein HypA/HybF